MKTKRTNDTGQTAAIQVRLDRAASALHAAATQRPQQTGVYLYCTQAVELLRAAEAAVARAVGHDAEDHHRGVGYGVAGHSVGRTPDTPALIRLALGNLAGLPTEEFTRDPVLAAARAAHRALHLTNEPAEADAGTGKADGCRPGSGAGPAPAR